MQNGQTPKQVRLRLELHKEVDRQLRRLGITISDEVSTNRHKADEVIANWLEQNANGPPEALLLEYASIAIVSRIVKWIPEGGLDDTIMPIWMKLFDRVVEAGVDERDLIQFNREIAESIMSPIDFRAREWIQRG